MLRKLAGGGLRLVAGVLGLSLLTAACGSGEPGSDAGAVEDDGLLVVATTTVLGDLVSDLVGDAGTVETLMEPGEDPHTFSPSAQDAALLREADLVVANGLGLEEALLDLLESAEEDAVEVLYVAEHVDPVTFGDHAEASHEGDESQGDEHAGEEGHGDEHASEEDHGDEHASEEDHGDGHGHGGEDALDPHVWLDPVRMAEAVPVVADRLAALDATDPAIDWSHRADEVAADILAAHEEIEAILAAVPDQCRELVTNHDAFGYFAARYGFEVVGTVIPGSSTAADPSARDFSELAEAVRSAGVPAIFAESSRSTQFADALAAEVGQDVEVVTLYTESVGDGSEADDYAGMMVENARRIAAALDECS